MGLFDIFKKKAKPKMPQFIAATDPLHDLVVAAREGDVRAINRLLDSGVDVNAVFKEWEDWNALHAAIAFDRADVVQLLISRGADIEYVIHNKTPLEHAVDRYGDVESMPGEEVGSATVDVILVLLSAGASRNKAMKIAQLYHSAKLIGLLSVM